VTTVVNRAEVLIRRIREADGTVCPECGSGAHDASNCPSIRKTKNELLATLNAAPPNSVYSRDLIRLLDELDRAISYSTSPTID
jgi:hypothetical protein